MSASLTALLTVLFAQATSVEERAPAPGDWSLRASAESQLQLWPVDAGARRSALYVGLAPRAGVERTDAFALDLAAPLRLRLDDADDTRFRLRREDWDERSDYGQVLERLAIGKDGDAFSLRAGALEHATLGLGHLVGRYRNRDNPDYHPAGARAQVNLDAHRLELLASDVLAARLFAGEYTLDLGRQLGAAPDRARISLSGAHDFARAGGQSFPITLTHVDASYAFLQGEGLQLLALVGGGTRFGAGPGGWGAVAGLAGEGGASVPLGAKLEVRKQTGGFRQGLFGPAYELARFSSIGVSSTPLGLERLPDGYSIYLEAFTTLRWLHVTAAGERFDWGRSELDVQLDLVGFSERLTASVRATGVGLEQSPRWLFWAESRYRIAPSLYGVLGGGWTYFPQGAEGLARAVCVGAGLGVDLATVL